MKNIIILSLLVVFISGCTVYPPPHPRYSINKEISLPGLDANTIFDKTEMWIARTFVDSRSVLEVKNREGKMLYANTILTSRNVSAKNSLEIYVKDDNLKIKLSDINIIDQKGNIIFFYEDKNLNKKFKESYEKKIQNLFLDLETFIKTPTW